MTNSLTRTIAKLHADVRRAWATACRHDGIKPTAKFAVLSDDNPHQDAYNKAITAWMDARRVQATTRPAW